MGLERGANKATQQKRLSLAREERADRDEEATMMTAGGPRPSGEMETREEYGQGIFAGLLVCAFALVWMHGGCAQIITASFFITKRLCPCVATEKVGISIRYVLMPSY